MVEQVEQRRLRPVDVVDDDESGRSAARISSSRRTAQWASSGATMPGCYADGRGDVVGDRLRSSCPPAISAIALTSGGRRAGARSPRCGQYEMPSP
jgi:hypothetical protein